MLPPPTRRRSFSSGHPQPSQYGGEVSQSDDYCWPSHHHISSVFAYFYFSYFLHSHVQMMGMLGLHFSQKKKETSLCERQCNASEEDKPWRLSVAGWFYMDIFVKPCSVDTLFKLLQEPMQRFIRKRPHLWQKNANRLNKLRRLSGCEQVRQYFNNKYFKS